MTDPLAHLRDLTERRESSAEDFGDIDTAWRQAIIEAAGVATDAEVAEVAHITRGRVYQIKHGRRT